MNELITKEVEFQGEKIVSMLQDNKIYISVKSVCENLGMDKTQRRTQRAKLQNDEFLKGGLILTPLSTNGGIQEVLMVELDYLPAWLFKINPARFDENLKKKLMIYQLKAKDVLAEAFLGKRVNQNTDCNDWARERMNIRLNQCGYIEKQVSELVNLLIEKYQDIENIARMKKEVSEDFLKTFKGKSKYDASKEKLPEVIIPKEE